jgi:hypothetical protein
MGIADYGQTPVLRSVLGPGANLLVCHWKVLLIALKGLERCNERQTQFPPNGRNNTLV